MCVNVADAVLTRTTQIEVTDGALLSNRAYLNFVIDYFEKVLFPTLVSINAKALSTVVASENGKPCEAEHMNDMALALNEVNRCYNQLLQRRDDIRQRKITKTARIHQRNFIKTLITLDAEMTCKDFAVMELTYCREQLIHFRGDDDEIERMLHALSSAV